jgi:hypothetical protein
MFGIEGDTREAEAKDQANAINGVREISHPTFSADEDSAFG